ncbi:MAG TPA: preprotein translocase subunit SecE [Candidatus Saccharimonadales bacterium]|nr:preprotein translocase subunit SecE [Candidatus Saccharimonadales bacterium]
MADSPAQETKKPKRRLRAPETVRERTEKLQQKAASPKRSGKLRTFFGGFLWFPRLIGRLLARIGHFLGRFRIFRWIGYILLPPYIRNSWRELRLVTWPDRRKTFRLTYAVIVFSVAFGLIVFGVDSVLDRVFKEIIVN